MNDFVFAIIETKRIPSRVFMSLARIEELVGIACKVAQSLHFVLHCMRVDDVHNNGNAMLVGLVDERFQFFGCSKTRRGRKERADMIAETAIIGMFLYGHYLYAIVSVFDNARQNKFFKFGVRPYLFGILPHTNVALVDEQGRSGGFKFLLRPLVSLFGLPNLRREDVRLFVLNHAAYPSRYAFSVSAVPINVHLVEVAMRNGLFR